MDEEAANYEQLIILIYMYRMGSITFLELVEQCEEVLGIRRPAPILDE